MVRIDVIHLYLNLGDMEEKDARLRREETRMISICLFVIFFLIGLAGATIYNLMRMQSEVGVSVAFIWSTLLFVPDYA